MSMAVEALLANLRDQFAASEINISDEVFHKIEDDCAGLVGEVAAMEDQHDVNNAIVTRISEVTDGNATVGGIVAETLDFFWQSYNDKAEIKVDID